MQTIFKFIHSKYMKNMALYAFATVLFVLVSCKQKTEKKLADITSENPVALIKDGGFEFINEDALQAKWQNIAGMDAKLEDIRIKKGKIADTPIDYYLLLGKTSDNYVKVAVLLEAKNSKLYFGKQEGSVIIVKCKGCKVGCDPQVVLQYGKPIVICTPCPDCIKQDEAQN